MNFDQWIADKFRDAKLTRDQMHGYQDTAYDHMWNNPFSALFIDMGLGKTVTAATLAVDLLFLLDNDDKILIIGPLRVATTTWPNEFRKWRHLAVCNTSLIHVDDDDPRLKAAAAKGRASARDGFALPSEVAKEATRAEAAMRETIRSDAAKSRASIHIISRDWIEWLVNFHGRKWPYRTVIIDESSGFKDHTTDRFKALAKVRNTPGLITRLHELTATPAAESYEHLFAQMFLMDGGQRLGKFITKYRERYFTHNKYTRKYTLREGGEDDVLAKISDICLVMKAADYLPMQEPLFVQREVVMSAGEEALYRQMENDMIVTLPDGTEIEAETAAALSSKLLQMASGVLYETQLLPGQTEDDDMVKVKKVHAIHTHKIDMLKQIVDEAQGKPLLIGYHFRSSLERLKKAFPKAVVMDKDGKCIKKWNQGKIPMLLMHPQSGGHGLNLQDGGHNIVFYDIPWSLELYLQFIGRLARQGQLHRVLVQLLVCRGTLDEAVVEALGTKEDAQEKMFKILKRIRAAAKRALDAKTVRRPAAAYAMDEEL